MEFYIGKEENGISVLDFLRVKLGISRAMIRELKYREGGIEVDGAHVTVRKILSEGETLSIKTEDEAASENIVPSDIPIEIAFEDDELVIPAKSPFMPTHPSHGHYDDTMANALAFRYKDAPTPFVFRPVNRLDRNTSGLVLVAKSRMAASRLFESMRRGEIKKSYIALLEGVLPESEGEIDAPIARLDASVILRTVSPSGASALTKYRVLFSDGEHSLVLCMPITGRTHQLRVHFAYLGASIVGDGLYGNESPLIARHALHAARLVLSHPKSGEELDVRAPLPDDMLSLIASLFGERADEALRALESL